MDFKKTLTAITMLISAWTLKAQKPELVKDINPNGSSTISHITVYNGKLYFSAEEYTHGVELWVSDGTTPGTQLLKDIYSGSNHGNPSSQATFDPEDKPFMEIDGTLYFRAYDSTNGGELWKSDGTSTNTQMVKDIFPGVQGSIPYGYIQYNGNIYFIANDGVHGGELWVTDGTPTGTQMVKDIWDNPNHASHASTITNFFVQDVNGGNQELLFFSAYDEYDNGTELWRTDGTENGTVLFKDINPGNGNSAPQNPISYKNKTYFSATDGTKGREIWVTDGTDNGTVMLKDINLGNGDSDPNDFFIFNGLLYFTANNGINGRELWVTDGTEFNTYMLKDINSAGDAFISYERVEYITYNGALYFACNDGSHGFELWSTDGIANNTKMVMDIAEPGQWSIHSGPRDFVIYKNLLFFTADDQITGRQLWATNGTENGTERITIPGSGKHSSLAALLTVFNDAIYYAADYNVKGEGRELWKYQIYPIECPKPSDITTSNSTSNSTEVTWTENGTTNVWEIEYGETGFEQGKGTIIYDNDGILGDTLKDLLPNLKYDVYVRANCYDLSTFSEWVGPKSFTTKSLSIASTHKNHHKIYPNPVKDILHINSPQPTTLKLYSLQGQLLKSIETQQNTTVSLIDLASGIYILKATDSNTSWKIIKQ